jgi:hypothetical protein
VKTTNESLQALTAASGGDLRPLFNKYAENVRKTQDMANAARDRAQAMREHTDDYVAQWQKEVSSISDEQLRQMSQQRAAKAKTEFDRIRSVAQDARAAYDPYMQGLQDVQQYLTNDLTAGGIQTIKPKADDTIRKGQTLEQKLADLQTELDGLSQKWSSKLGESGR